MTLLTPNNFPWGGGDTWLWFPLGSSLETLDIITWRLCILFPIVAVFCSNSFLIVIQNWLHHFSISFVTHPSAPTVTETTSIFRLPATYDFPFKILVCLNFSFCVSCYTLGQRCLSSSISSFSQLQQCLVVLLRLCVHAEYLHSISPCIPHLHFVGMFITSLIKLLRYVVLLCWLCPFRWNSLKYFF